MRELKIVNAKLVNEGVIQEQDLLIIGERIVKIGKEIDASASTRIYDAKGKYIIPGLIDDQVHFREPGLTHKATIETGGYSPC